MRTRSQSGLTLVEVSVVLAIIGILAAIAVPSLNGLMPRNRLSNTTSTLANEISLARVRAIAKAARFRITFTLAAAPAPDSYSLWRETSGSWVSITTVRFTDTDLASVTGFLAADEVTADTNGTMSVAFNTQGVIRLSTADGQFQRRILVQPIGRVSVEHSTNGGSTWIAE